MSGPYETNRYRAMIVRHIDADTTYVRIDYGFDQQGHYTIRWAGINAPEKRTDEGKIALARVVELMPEGSRVELTTIKDKREKFGRYLGTFWVNGENLNERLIAEGLARPYTLTESEEGTTLWRSFTGA